MGKNFRRMMKDPKLRFIFIATLVAIVVLSFVAGRLYNRPDEDNTPIGPPQKPCLDTDCRRRCGWVSPFYRESQRKVLSL